MPWKTCDAMELRRGFVALARGGGQHQGAIPAIRHQPADGLQIAGAGSFGREPPGSFTQAVESPGKPPAAMEELIVAARHRHPAWGGGSSSTSGGSFRNGAGSTTWSGRTRHWSGMCQRAVKRYRRGRCRQSCGMRANDMVATMS